MLNKEQCKELINKMIDIGRLKKDPKDENRILVYLGDDPNLSSITIDDAAQGLSEDETGQKLLQYVIEGGE